MLKKIKKSLHFIKGFTIIEMLVVIANIAILSTIVIVGIRGAREKANIALSAGQQRALTRAVELYYNDVGFYPPDVNRGWDPGLAKVLPSNPDIDSGVTVPGAYATSGENCSHCPTDWKNIVSGRWNGPYISNWPTLTQWKGKYDYNYWATITTRGPCTLPPGIYVGAQGDYDNQNTIPESSEEEMIEKGFDFEKCINAESQMILVPLSP